MTLISVRYTHHTSFLFPASKGAERFEDDVVDNAKKTVFVRHNVIYTYGFTVIVTAYTDWLNIKQDKLPAWGREGRHETYH